MKQFSVLAFLCVLASCRAPRFYMGESEQEFVKHNRVELVSATGRSTVYKKVNYPFGGTPIIKFFYFTDGKLTEVNEGQRGPDIIVEHRN